MSNKKFSELPNLVGTPDDDSVVALSEWDGESVFESVRMNLTQLKNLVNNPISGEYTPTSSNTTNITSTTPAVCQYQKIGSIVTVFGACKVDITSSGNFVFDLSLPIASDLFQQSDANGTGRGLVATVADVANVVIYANGTSNKVTFKGMSNVLAEISYYFCFAYKII